MSTHRVAVVQAGSALFDTPRTLDKLAALTADAAGRGAKLVVFPEAFVGGYPKGLGFGARMGSRTPEGREEFRRYFDAAVEVPGPATTVIGNAAREHGVHLVVGAVERAGSTLYCTALFFGPDGSLLAKHRKLIPTAMERLVWGQGDGSTLPVIDTPVGKVGAVICWENYMPLVRTAMYAKGIEVYCAVTVDDRDTWLPTMRHIALEGRCFVLSACQYLTRKDCPSDYPAGYGDDPNAVLIRGGSCIVGPLGQVFAGPVFGEVVVLTADLDLDDIPRARFDFDPVGHYARPDVFKLSVNEAPQPAVEFVGPPGGFPTTPLRLVGVPGNFGVCKLPAGSAVPGWATAGDVWSVAGTADELSVVCRQDAVPVDVTCEPGWRCLRVAGGMPFTLVGVLASLTAPVARAGVGVFAFSTFDTDYLLVKAADLPTAVAALRAAGHSVEGGDVVTTADRVRLRPIEPVDLPRMFDLQLDPESNRMAVTIPRTREAFDALWEKSLADPAATARAVLLDGTFVGYVSRFPADGQAHVGYWIDRTFWGMGIASRALNLLLSEVTDRPLFATVATSNGASLRVLQKCGFVVENVRHSPATDRYPECEETLLVLR